MLSLVMFRDMNRSEQENLYRTSRKLSLVPINQSTSSQERRVSRVKEDELAYQNEGAYRRHSYKMEEDFTLLFAEDLQRPPTPHSVSEDLVLSVLKSPVNHSTYGKRECSPNEDYCTQLNNDTDDDRCKPHTSEDEEYSENLPFLHHLRDPPPPRHDESNQRRVPTPIKRSRKKEKLEKILAEQEEDEEVDEVDDIVDPPLNIPRGVPDPLC
ncbi:uncharacterized protein [Diabrotica undecimpunctata]|uniref:uncharacterized protein n=1 Tax=Diabrotica undecimpunctata TaxID=50387 RepID=UPI003B63B265